MRNLAEPGARFRAAAPNHPGALLEEPRAFQAVGEKIMINTKSCLILQMNIYQNLCSMAPAAFQSASLQNSTVTLSIPIIHTSLHSNSPARAMESALADPSLNWATLH